MGRPLPRRRGLHCVSCAVSLLPRLLTLVLGHRGDLCEKLDKVWEVIFQEFRADNNIFAGMVGLQGRSEQFRLALYPKCRPSFGALCANYIQHIVLFQANAIWLFLTLNAYRSRPSARPGRGWKRVPAWDTRATVATGPGISRAASLTPLASPTWYWKDPRKM